MGIYRNVFLLISLGLCFSKAPAQEVNYLDHIYDYIENPAVYELNQEEGRAWHTLKRSVLLNGDWKFFYSDTPEGTPRDFYKEKFNDKKWATIQVPGNWEMQHFGDKLFRNVASPFIPNPPFTPREYNPSGGYRRTFTLPSDWKGSQVFLRFEKVASASFVWINGQEVGYNEGAQEPAEYNITSYLKAGVNTIAVHVTKYSDGYFLEGQDYWRLAGIFDDVLIYATPQTRLFDYQVITDLDSEYKDAQLKLKVDVQKYDSKLIPLQVKARLFDNRKQLVTTLEVPVPDMNTAGKTSLNLTDKIITPRKWTSETPELYALSIQLLDNKGKVVDEINTRIGFKETEIRGEVFYLNGVPVKVKATNTHMQHPELGHVMDEATIRKDFEILKQFNFNTVRTSHYPPVNKYLELADEYGLFIIDEVGDESHATEFVSEMPEFTEMYKERVRRMVLRDRNRPCILFWSAGNESGEGFNITEVIKEGKRLDPSRLWMYGGNAFSHPAEDIIGPRYPLPMALEMQVGIPSQEANRRPSFLDEYLSVAGNGGGALDDYWKIFYAYPRIMGGAIWDFVSTGLTEIIREVHDLSPATVPAHLMGNARLVKGPHGNAVDLNGHDQWVEIYRAGQVEVNTDKLTLSMDVYPRKLVSSCGSFVTKGSYQFGIQQQGKNELEFYLYTDKKQSVRATLPADWENNWHRVAAVYDGQVMKLYIDGAEKASAIASGCITNFPFPINIGRNAEIHGQETKEYICDAILDNVGVFTQALAPEALATTDPQSLAQQAVLFLDFEKETSKGPYYSYGIGARTYGSIWPDRTVQPEMWQMKKSQQPFTARLLDANQGVVELTNRNNFLDLSHYKTHWQLEADGKVIQEGPLLVSLPAQSTARFTIPYIKPALVPGVEYRLYLSSALPSDELWAKAGHEIAWEQLDLGWLLPLPLEAACTEGARVNTSSDSLLVITGNNNDFSYTFNKKTGLLTSMLVKGKELIKEEMKLNVWRAPLANEQDSWCSRVSQSTNSKEGYGHLVASEFYAVGIDDLHHQPVSFVCREVNGIVQIEVRDLCVVKRKSKKIDTPYEESLQTNGFENEYQYTIDGKGEIRIKHTISPSGIMPVWLPRMGVSWVFNKELNCISWYGRGPQENYPDRKSGYRIGIYHSTVQDMYEPYILPEDYGLRTDNRWVEIKDHQGIGLRMKCNEHFNFNAYPFSTDNLTKAMYTYQLQEQDGITFNLDYATSGVGSTDNSIFNPYRVMPQRMEREIVIQLL